MFTLITRAQSNYSVFQKTRNHVFDDKMK